MKITIEADLSKASAAAAYLRRKARDNFATRAFARLMDDDAYETVEFTGETAMPVVALVIGVSVLFGLFSAIHP